NSFAPPTIFQGRLEPFGVTTGRYAFEEAGAGDCAATTSAPCAMRLNNAEPPINAAAPEKNLRRVNMACCGLFFVYLNEDSISTEVRLSLPPIALSKSARAIQ